jgi:hypothetical protein
MKVVIQCAGAKHPNAATFESGDGRRVSFVARPELVTRNPGILHAHPDQPSDIPGKIWRDRVVHENNGADASTLLPAAQLYTSPTYAALERFIGSENLFILSAGWGLVRGSFRLPAYDISFSGSADPHCRRRSGDEFADFNALAEQLPGDTVFLGGKDYLPLFLRLTASDPGRRLVFFNASRQPQAPGCLVQPYITPRRTNWHYSCASDLIQGVLVPNFGAA